jgi:hypothetical protein
LLKDLVLQTPIGEAAQAYLARIKRLNSVSVHIRLNDLQSDCHKIGKNRITDGENRAPTISLEYYKRAVDKLLKSLKEPIFFVFSNDHKRCKANMQFIPNAIFVDQTQNELEDFELMRNCKYNIIANSTFSWHAAWLNDAKDKRVIAPSVWYEYWREFDPCPPNWERA